MISIKSTIFTHKERKNINESSRKLNGTAIIRLFDHSTKKCCNISRNLITIKNIRFIIFTFKIETIRMLFEREISDIVYSFIFNNLQNSNVKYLGNGVS